MTDSNLLLYPSSSTMSRDPLGWDGNHPSTGLDPPASFQESEVQEEEQEEVPVENKDGLFPHQALDLAAIVGAPPPPPPTPPPTARRQRTPRSSDPPRPPVQEVFHKASPTKGMSQEELRMLNPLSSSSSLSSQTAAVRDYSEQPAAEAAPPQQSSLTPPAKADEDDKREDVQVFTFPTSSQPNTPAAISAAPTEVHKNTTKTDHVVSSASSPPALPQVHSGASSSLGDVLGKYQQPSPAASYNQVMMSPMSTALPAVAEEKVVPSFSSESSPRANVAPTPVSMAEDVVEENSPKVATSPRGVDPVAPSPKRSTKPLSPSKNQPKHSATSPRRAQEKDVKDGKKKRGFLKKLFRGGNKPKQQPPRPEVQHEAPKKKTEAKSPRKQKTSISPKRGLSTSPKAVAHPQPDSPIKEPKQEPVVFTMNLATRKATESQSPANDASPVVQPEELQNVLLQVPSVQSSEDSDYAIPPPPSDPPQVATLGHSDPPILSYSNNDPPLQSPSLAPQSTDPQVRRRLETARNFEDDPNGENQAAVATKQHEDPAGLYSAALHGWGFQPPPTPANKMTNDPSPRMAVTTTPFFMKEEDGEFMDPSLAVGGGDESQASSDHDNSEVEAMDDAVPDASSVVSDPPLDLHEQGGYLSDGSSSVVVGAEEEKKEDDHPVAVVPPPSTTSKATAAAALKLNNVGGMDDIRAQLDKIPTPTNFEGETNMAPVGSQSVLSQSPQEEPGSEDPPDVEEPVVATADQESTPAKKALSVHAAAFTNAKAVAYIHKLHGSPSPRHSYYNPEMGVTVVESKKKRSRSLRKGMEKVSPKAAAPPPPSPYGWQDKYEGTSFATSEYEFPASRDDLTILKNDDLNDEEAEDTGKIVGKKLGGYRSTFKGRKPGKKKPQKSETPPTTPRPPRTPSSQARPEDKITLDPALVAALRKSNQRPNFQGTITTLAVAKGIGLRRNKREEDIRSGRATPVVLTPKPQPEGRNRFNFVPADESEIKDPIQRAGRRLLSKSAIPIQCAIRRYLARQEAIDRMWAVIELQSYIRRWRAEASFQAHRHSATVIQTRMRGVLARQNVENMHSSATQIQRIMRGYLASAHVYDQMYFIVQIQSVARMFLAKRRAAELHEEFRHAAATLLQANWRAYIQRTEYQFQIVDVIISQSIVRRWMACRLRDTLKFDRDSAAASIIQSLWRKKRAIELERMSVAAVKVQAAWRGFQAYTDYIFTLVDVLVIQRTFRQWLAKAQVRRMRQHKAAIIVQKEYRRHRAQLQLMFSMMDIIIVQSVARRYISKYAVAEARKQQALRRFVLSTQEKAATKIQAAWRGFWHFSHFIIMQYEATRIQAMVRGQQARQAFGLRLGCAIIIQATARQFLAKRQVDSMMVHESIVAGKVQELRERNAAKRVQFWWRIVLDWTKEKKAALVIERFFIHVRAEVDREIMRHEQKKNAKKQKRRKKKKENDEKVLEKVWLNTVDEEKPVDAADSHMVKASSSKTSMSPRIPKPEARSNRSSAPSPSSANRSPSRSNVPPSPSPSEEHSFAVNFATSEDASDVSGITNPTAFLRTAASWQRLRQSKTDRSDLSDEVKIDESYAELKPKSEKMTTEDYIKKYGLQSAPNRLSKEGTSQFFSDDSNSSSAYQPRRVSSGSPRTGTGNGSYTPRNSTTPRSSSKRMELSARKQIPPSPRAHAAQKGGKGSFFPPSTPPRHEKFLSRATETFDTAAPTVTTASYDQRSPVRVLGTFGLGDEYGEV